MSSFLINATLLLLTLTVALIQPTTAQTFADVTTYSDSSCTKALLASQIYGPGTTTQSSPFHSFIVANAENIGTIVACEKGCDNCSDDSSDECFVLTVQTDEIATNKCLYLAPDVEFGAFFVSQGAVSEGLCTDCIG